LSTLYRAYSRLTYILTTTGSLPDPSKEISEFRYSNPLKIFEQCFFIKPVKYSEYIIKMQEHFKDPSYVFNLYQSKVNEGLGYVSTTLKEAIDCFKQVPIDEKLCPFSIAQSIGKITRICVVTSVAVMKLRGGKGVTAIYSKAF
jgi:hypothetical protein